MCRARHGSRSRDDAQGARPLWSNTNDCTTLWHGSQVLQEIGFLPTGDTVGHGYAASDMPLSDVVNNWQRRENSGHRTSVWVLV